MWNLWKKLLVKWKLTAFQIARLAPVSHFRGSTHLPGGTLVKVSQFILLSYSSSTTSTIYSFSSIISRESFQMIFILFSYNVFCSLAWSQPRNQSLGEVTTSHLSQVIIIKVLTKPDEKVGFIKISLHVYHCMFVTFLVILISYFRFFSSV